MGKIVAAFAGVGKSYVGSKYKNVLDLESTYFKWLSDGLENLSEEERKGKKDRVLNPQWPQNYIEEIIKQKDRYDIVLIQLSHPRLQNEQIFKYFDKNKIEYYVARPNLSGWQHIEDRLRQRKNTEEFISQVRDNFKIFISEFSKPKYNQIIIPDGKFLEDALLLNKFINKSLQYLGEKMIITSYIMSALAIVFVSVAMFCKKRRDLIFILIFANLFYLLSLIFVKGYVGAGSLGLTTVAMLVFYLYERKNKRSPLAVLIAILLIEIILNAFFISSVFDAIVILGASVYFIGAWQTNQSLLRLSSIVMSSTYVIYNIVFAAYINLVLESILIISTIIPLIMYWKLDFKTKKHL